jgi:hypothetical protein
MVHPERFPFYPDLVPEELKTGKFWVCCDADKVPQVAGTGRRASSTDPKTWRTYEEVTAAYDKGQHAGVGRVIAHEDDFVGIDLDGIVNNDGIVPEALELLRFLDSYSEISPSGTGIKVWVRGRLDRSYKKPGLEVYQPGRYFTITGQILPQFSARIEDRQQEVEALVKRAFSAPAPRLLRDAVYDGPPIDLDDYLDRVEVFSEVHDSQGIKYAIRCPWANEHTSGVTGTYLGQRHNGATWFYCHHAHCAHRGWREFTKALFWNRTTEANLPGYTGSALRMELRYGG